jgi:hypothetical protein
MAYVKNVMDRDSITGAFLNSDDTGLTTNVFLTEPRLYGLRVTKEWNGASWWTNGTHASGQPYPFTLEVGGMLQWADASYDPVRSTGNFTGAIDPAHLQNHDLDLGHDVDVKLAYAPSGAAWSASAAIRYGKTKGEEKGSATQPGDSGCFAGPSTGPYVPDYSAYCQNPQFIKYTTDWSRTAITNKEEHLFADFDVGRDVGLGQAVSVGLRYAQFDSTTKLDMQGIPDWYVPDWNFVKYSNHHDYDVDLVGSRKFRGLGPVLSWDAAHRLFSSPTTGNLDLEAGLSGGVLFGDQKTSVEGKETTIYHEGLARFFPLPAVGYPVEQPRPASRSNSTSVPTLAAELGLSYGIERFKVRAGYRWERYYDVLDAGYAERKSYDRTFDGPYFKIAVGFGG